MYCVSVYQIYHTNYPTLWSYICVIILMITTFFLLKVFIKSNNNDKK